MMHSLGLEFIGENKCWELSLYKRRGQFPPVHLLPFTNRRPWVKEITGISADGQLIGKIHTGFRDYAKCNGSGYRGIYLYYYLEDGKIYEVHELTGWHKTSRYFLRYDADGNAERLSADEVKQCLNKV